MDYKRDKTIWYCDKFIEFNLYLLAFFLPISKGIIEVTSSLAIVTFLIKKTIHRQSVHTYLNLPLSIFVAISGLSIIGTDSLYTGLRNFFFKLIQQVLLFFVIFDTLNTRQKIKNILWIMLASAFLVSIDGLFQYFTHQDFLRHRSMPFKKRINASFYTPNDLGAYLVPLTMLSLSTIFLRLKNIFINLIPKILFPLLFICLILTFSRGAWLSFIAGVIFMVTIMLLLKNKNLFLIALLLIFILLMSLPLRSDIPLHKILDFSDAGTVDRRGLWTIAWNMVKAKPFFGHGIGTFMHNFKKYDTIGYSHGVSYAHNCYLQMAADIGIAGVLVFLWMIITVLKKSIGIILETKDGLDILLLGLISSLGAFLIHSAVETNLYSLDLGTLFWVILGLVVSASTPRSLELS